MRFRIEQQEGRRFIYDPLRGKLVPLTPEEWVRQQWIHRLIHAVGVPPSRLAVERAIRVNRMLRRFDLVVFGRNGRPTLVMECKASNRPLGTQTLEQVCRYNLALNVRFLVISNGVKTFVLERNAEKAEFQRRSEFPSGQELQ